MKNKRHTVGFFGFFFVVMPASVIVGTIIIAYSIQNRWLDPYGFYLGPLSGVAVYIVLNGKLNNILDSMIDDEDGN